MQSRGIILGLIEFAGKLPQTHLLTLAVGLTTLAVIIGKQTFVASRAGAVAGHGSGCGAGLWPWLGDQRCGGCR